MRTEFGELLKTRRKAANLSQTQVGKSVGVDQATVSAWENGKQLPDIRDQRLFKSLSTTLAVEAAMLMAAVQRDQSTRENRVPSGLGVTAFIAQQQQYIETVCKWKADIWLICPTILPVIVFDQIKETWVANLNNGLNYRVIWPLDLMDKPSLLKLRDAALVIESRMEHERPEIGGKIVHYPVSVFAPEVPAAQDSFYRQDLMRENSQFYESLVAAASKVNDFQKPTFRLPDQTRYRVLQQASKNRTLVVYVPREPGVAALASFGLQSVRPAIDAAPIFVWYFACEDRTSDLVVFIKEFETHFKKAPRYEYLS